MKKDEFLQKNTAEKLAYVSGKNEVSKPQKKKITQKQKQRLQNLAYQIIGEYSNKTKADIINEIQKQTGVNADRANNGFKQMVSYKIVSHAIGDRYYLTGSIPF